MTRILLFAFSLALFLVLAFPFQTQAKGSVNVGDTIPHDLSLKDHKGNIQSFSELSGKNGMVLVFVRSVEWCPFCQKQVIELNDNRQKFIDEGYSVVVLSYDQVEHMKKFITKQKPEIILLSDPSSEAIRAFGILNTASAKGTMSYGIAYPGVYLVSKDKKVQAKFFKQGYKERTSISEILGAIKDVHTPPAPKAVIPEEPAIAPETTQPEVTSQTSAPEMPAMVEPITPEMPAVEAGLEPAPVIPGDVIIDPSVVNPVMPAPAVVDPVLSPAEIEATLPDATPENTAPAPLRVAP